MGESVEQEMAQRSKSGSMVYSVSEYKNKVESGYPERGKKAN